MKKVREITSNHNSISHLEILNRNIPLYLYFIFSGYRQNIPNINQTKKKKKGREEKNSIYLFESFSLQASDNCLTDRDDKFANGGPPATESPGPSGLI